MKEGTRPRQTGLIAMVGRKYEAGTRLGTDLGYMHTGVVIASPMGSCSVRS